MHPLNNDIDSVHTSPPKQGLLTQLARNRSLVASFLLGGLVLFFGISYIVPQRYESMATILPQERSGMGGMLSMLAGGASGALDLLKGADNPALELFKTIIESRNVAEEVAKDPVIRKYVISQTHDTSTESVAATLQGGLKTEVLRTGMFTVTMAVETHAFAGSPQTDSARRMSAYIANAYVAELDRFNRDRLMTNARNTRVFIEREYKNRLTQLDSVYGLLQAFQEQNKAISLPEQLTATVGAAAKLTGEIQQLEMQLGVEEHDLNANSSRVQLLRAQLDAAREQLRKYDDGGAGEYVIALRSVPQLSRQLAGYMREAKVLEQVTAYLRQQLEQERISEQRDLPSLQVLDSAPIPDKRASPHRSVMAILGACLGLIAATMVVVGRSYSQSVKQSPSEHYRFLNFVSAIRRGKNAPLIKPTTASTSAVDARSLLVTQEQEA